MFNTYSFFSYVTVIARTCICTVLLHAICQKKEFFIMTRAKKTLLASSYVPNSKSFCMSVNIVDIMRNIDIMFNTIEDTEQISVY